MYNLRRSTVAQTNLTKELDQIREKCLRHIEQIHPLCQDELIHIQEYLKETCLCYPAKAETCQQILKLFPRHPNDGQDASTNESSTPDDVLEMIPQELDDDSPNSQCSQSIFADCDQDWFRWTYFRLQTESVTYSPGHRIESIDLIHTVSSSSRGNAVLDRDGNATVEVATQCPALVSHSVGTGTDEFVEEARGPRQHRALYPNVIVLSRQDVARIANHLQMPTDELLDVIHSERRDYQIDEIDVEYVDEEIPDGVAHLTPLSSDDESAISATPPDQLH